MTVRTFQEFLAIDPPHRKGWLTRAAYPYQNRTQVEHPVKPRQRPMNRVEVLDEAEFLIRGGVAPRVAATTLGVTYETLLTNSRRLGRLELHRLLQEADTFRTWNHPTSERNAPGNGPVRPVDARNPVPGSSHPSGNPQPRREADNK